MVLGGTPGPSAGHMVCACSVAKSCPTLYSLHFTFGEEVREEREKRQGWEEEERETEEGNVSSVSLLVICMAFHHLN